MARLKLAAIPFRIHVVAHRRAFQLDCLVEHGDHFAVEPLHFVGLQVCAKPRGMNLRAPECFVCINVSHAGQRALVKQQRLDPVALPREQRAKLFEAHRQRIHAERRRFCCGRRARRKQPHLPEAAHVGVAELAAVIEREKHMRVRRHGRVGQAHCDLSRHAEMDGKRAWF